MLRPAGVVLAAWAVVRAEDKHCHWHSYATRYADVRAAFGYDEKALRAHYVAHGRGEGRACAAGAAPAPALACAPDCDLGWAAGLVEEAARPQAWTAWDAPGGISVQYLSRPDMAHGGGNTAFGAALVDKAAALGTHRRCLEFCAGPGFIGFALLGRAACTNLVLADVNPLSVAAARETIRVNELGDRAVAYVSDGLAGLPQSEEGRLDLVVSNPPHFVSADAWDAWWAMVGGARTPSSGRTRAMTVDAGWRLHARFYANIGRFLAPGGRVIFQENAGGSAPEDFLSMVRAARDLTVARIDGPDEHRKWYLEVIRADPVTSALEELKTRGFAVVSSTGADRATDLQLLRARLVARLEEAEMCKTTFGSPGCATTDESAHDDHSSYRLWGLLGDAAVGSLVRPLVDLPVIRRIAAARLGADHQLHGCTAYVGAPSARENVWHYDFTNQEAAFRTRETRLHDGEYGTHLSAMVFLQDTDERNGATMVAPGSHRWPARNFVTTGKVRDFTEMAAAAGAAGINATRTAVSVNEGGVLFFDGALLHATGAFPAGAATPAAFRYAVVIHFATQRASRNWHRTAMGTAYLGGHARLEASFEEETVLFHPHDDLDAIAAAFARRRGLDAAALTEALRAARHRHPAPEPPPCGTGAPQDDAWSERFAEVDAATAGLRNLAPHEYNHLKGPWLENAWIARWRDQPKEAFGGRVPVFAQWTDAVFLRGTDDATDAVIAASIEALKAAMRPDVAYVTVSQHSLGLRVLDAGLADLKNLLVLSAGGAGDVALPLVADGITRPFDDGGEFTAALLPRKYTFLLCGRATHAVRRRIADIIAGDPTLDAATVTYFGQDWRSRLNEATYVVAPRGYGRSSFFLYECLAAGALPIYVYDDEPWLPYALPVDVVRVDALGDVMRRLLDAPRAPEDLAARRAAALAAAPHLSFDGLWAHVADFFGGRGPLRCRPRPAATQTPPQVLPNATAPFREIVVNLVPPMGAAPGPEAVRWFANETALDAARRFAAVHGVATAPECGVACAVGRLEAVMLRDADRRPSVTANNCETYTECMSAARARAL